MPRDWYTISPSQPEREQPQLELHDAVRPQAGKLLVRGQGDRRPRPGDGRRPTRASSTVNAQVAGDAPPDGKLNVTGTVTGGQSLRLDLAGTATDDMGVAAVRVSLFDGDTSKYLQTNGTLATAFATLPATLASPDATSTTWTYGVDLPQGGDWNVTAFASRHRRASRTPRRPGHGPLPDLPRGRPTGPDREPARSRPRAPRSPTAGSSSAVEPRTTRPCRRSEVAIVDSQGRYMDANGAFPNTSASWRTAFLTSPGTVGSNFTLHHARRTPGRLHRAGAWDRQPRPGHGGAVRAPRHGHAPRGQHHPGGRLLGRRATRTSARTTAEARPTRTPRLWSTRGTSGTGPGAGRCRSGRTPRRTPTR